MRNALYRGDNLAVMRRFVSDACVDLCYIDPPFNSNRNYAHVFVDTWAWDDGAQECFDEIVTNAQDRYTTATVDLLRGLRLALERESLLAYLVAMAARINEIQRVLKETGVFYLHCDQAASHYLKVICDAVFLPRGGAFRNEIVWCYSGGGIPRRDFPRKHDTIFRYTKSDEYFYAPEYRPYTPGTLQRGRTAVKGKYFKTGLRKEGTPVADWWPDIAKITSPTDPEKLGYPTQKSQALLRRIIATSSRPGDLVLDACCGSGTAVTVAEELGRRWIGIDIAPEAIVATLHRLKENFGSSLSEIAVDGAAAI